jgi:putative ABC transport system substrate-binding protein
VIVATGGEPSPQVAKAATQTIPIVFMANGDPVAAGLVASLNQPGGNATGVTIFGMMAVGKRLELLRQVMPKAGIIAYLTNPNNPNPETDNVQTAARSLGQQILVLNANSDREFDSAFATIAQQRVAALLVASDPLFFDRRHQLVSLAARQAIPAIYYLRAFSQWRPVKLRKQPVGYVSPRRNIHGSHSQRRKTSRPASDAGNQVRVGHQLKDRDDARP